MRTSPTPSAGTKVTPRILKRSSWSPSKSSASKWSTAIRRRSTARAGTFPYILHALKERGKIFDILDKHRTQDAQEGERERYYPVSIFCPHCGKDSTTITSLSEDCTKAHYVCECGHEADFDFTKDFNCKLQWKVDWPMRWKAEGVDFEPGGKDHASRNGSYDTAKDISREVFGYEAPLFQGYEFIGIKGGVGKMSSSSGLNMTPDFLLRLYLPEMILWLYAKNEPLKAFDFCLSDEILRQYFEFAQACSKPTATARRTRTRSASSRTASSRGIGPRSSP